MKISRDSMEWAKTHIKKYYDSDFYPTPFEYNAIWKNWDQIIEFTTKKQIKDINVKQPIYHVAPKANNGFRVVHQLNPIDSIIYTALAYETANFIEEKRKNVADDSVCSYRIKMNSEGNFFQDGSGYKDFVTKSELLAKNYAYTMMADFTDFYNQIYVHRLQNNIESCHKSLMDISKSIESFLMKLTTKVSKGVPVGPAASIIFSEATLIDIDQFITNRTENYVRYVDDIRIFSNSKLELEEILHDLVKYVHDNHRLTFNYKTQILESSIFLEAYINKYNDKEKKAFEKALNRLSIKVNTGEYSKFEPIKGVEQLDDSSAIKIQATALEELMKTLISMKTLDLGLARSTLRRCKELRSRAIQPILLENFDFFAPVIRDVILYLSKVSTAKSIDHNIDRIADGLIKNSRFIRTPFINYWACSLFTDKSYFKEHKPITQFITKNQFPHKIRINAFHAINTSDISWVREHKANIDNYSPDNKRAIIYASQILSKDERNKWMDSLINDEDLLVASVAKWIKNK